MIKIVPTRYLRVGMYLSPENDRWVPTGARSRRGLIAKLQSVEQIERLGVTEVYIDTERGLDSEHAWPYDPGVDVPVGVLRQQEQSGVANPGLNLSSVSPDTTRLHRETLKLVGDIMARVRDGRELDLSKIEDAADEIVESIFRNRNELSCLTRIREKDAYLLEHSLNVGVLIAMLGKYLMWDRHTLRQATVGGILHDVGKILVPDAILNKAGKLEPDEWEEMKNHVRYGFETLREYQDLDPIVLSVCRQHHERIDGTGYPRQLGDGQIDRFGRIAAVCDVYDAITADRVYHRGMSPTRAMKRLVEWSDNHLDRSMVYQFIRCMSVYPEGTFVRLADDREAVVVRANTVHQSRPLLRVYFTPDRGVLPEPESLDLDRPESGTVIASALEPDQLPPGISLQHLL